MTDLAKFKDVVGRVQQTTEVPGDDETITLRVDNEGEYGYNGFFSEWTFNRITGRLVAISHWEE